MPFLHLAIWPKGEDAPDHKAVQAVLNKARDWYRYAPNCWVIYTGRDAEWWYEKLSNIPGMKGDASFFIAELKIDNRAGWVSPRMWRWLEQDRP
jgi:hypothetical protein